MALRFDIEGGFHCRRCGDCCRAGGWVYLTEAEAAEIAAFLGLALVDFLRDFTRRDRGWLILSSYRFRPDCFLDEQLQQCRIHALVKPESCRTYPWEFLDRAEFLAALRICPELRRCKEEKRLSPVAASTDSGKQE